MDFFAPGPAMLEEVRDSAAYGFNGPSGGMEQLLGVYVPGLVAFRLGSLVALMIHASPFVAVAARSPTHAEFNIA